MSGIYRCIAAVGVAGMIAVVAAGCDSRDDSTASAGPAAEPVVIRQGERLTAGNPGSKTAMTFDAVLQCWQKGQTQEAAAAFLTLDWKNPDVFSGHRCLTLSENQFAALHRSEQQSLSAQAVEMSASIKALTRFFAEQAKTARAENRPEDARQYQQALMDLADALSGSDKLELIRMVGKAVRNFTQKELAEM